MGKFYSTTLQHGSKGDEVKEWQNFLISQGYELSADGDFGDYTQQYTIDWQNKHGLYGDGIVGKNTWSKAGYSAAPTLQTAPTYTPHDTTPYGGTVIGKDENGNDITDKQAMDTAYNDFTGYGDPNWDKQTEYDTLSKNYRERDPFSYDFNADALYQQYKDRYIQQGKMAMQDAMGQAAALTGGYGSSYAASVGNQAYQQSLQQLNDVIPELYQLAYNKHNQEGQDMLNALGLLETDRDMYMDDWQTGYNKLLSAYDLAEGVYNRNSSAYYNNLDRKNTASDKEFDAALAIVGENNDNYWKYAAEDESNDTSIESVDDKVKNDGPDDDIEDDIEDDFDYSDWEAGDWNSYFAEIRHSEGKAAAEKELDYFIKQGLIPQNMISYAATGARGSLGH